MLRIQSEEEQQWVGALPPLAGQAARQGPPFVLASEVRSPALNFSTGMAAPGSKDASGSASGGGGGQAASGGVKTPVKKAGVAVGQKKGGEAMPAASQPANKKQKTQGPDADQSIDALNDVTAVSGVNLREEEEQLLAGPKEESRTTEAMRKFVQEEEERLFLEKNPLRAKVQVIAAKCGLSLSDDMERCLSLACEERLRSMLYKLIKYSKQRCDVEKDLHGVVVGFDPRRQVLLMKRRSKEAMEEKQAAENERLRPLYEAQQEEDDKMRAKAANAAARAAVGATDMLSKWQMMAAQGLGKRQGGDTDERQENGEAGKAAGSGRLDTDGDGAPGSAFGGRAAVKGRYTAPVLMLVEALDMLLTQLAVDGFPFHKVYAISGSAQQHGSVYWTQGACDSLLKKLDPSKSLLSQLQNAFATQDCPMWMDSTTSAQCSAIEEALGGAASVTALTGSRSIERYTGPQIRKIYETQEVVYHATERVSLISSFMASLLVGDYVAIDYSDAAGMTLMDLHHRTWSPDALNATAPGLEDKLGPLAVPHSMAGKLHPYYVDRYNFSPSCQIVHWSGDNPCSLAGLTMTHPGDIAVSLGTGDTVFGVTYDSHPGLDGHVFPNPIDPNTYVAMLVHKNGSLSREEVRNRYANGSWEAFNELLDKTPPLTGRMGFYYKEWESLPPLPVGYHRYVLEQSTSDSYTVQDAKKVPDFDAAAEVRAIVEGQFLSMRAHAERIGLPCPPKRVIATGGGSTNKHLLALMATIFGCDVYTANCPDSAPLGAALRAAHGWMCHEEDAFVPLASILERAIQTNAFQCSLLAKKGSRELHDKYGQLAKVRMEIEQQLLEEINPRQAEVRVKIFKEHLEETYPHREAIASGLDRAVLDF